MLYPNFIDGSYTVEHATVATERTINWFPALLETGGAKSQAVLLPVPGVELFVRDTTAATSYVAASMSVSPGTLDSGTVVNTQTVDGTGAGASEDLTGLTWLFTFTAVSAFDTIVIYGYYNGLPDEDDRIAIELWNAATGLWEEVEEMLPSSTLTRAWYAITIADGNTYINGDKRVWLRFRLDGTAAVTHNLALDYVALQDGAAPVRGLFTDPSTQRCFAVTGNQFGEVTATDTGIYSGSPPVQVGTTVVGGLTVRGTLSYSDAYEPVTISSNGDGGGELFITSNGTGYCFNLATNTLTSVVGTGANLGASLDGYFIALDTTTSTFAISELYDGLTWVGTQIQQRSKASDRWVGMTVNGSDLYLVGSQTTDIWYNAGTSPFPFALNPTTIPFGTPAPHSVKTVGGTVCWLAQTPSGLTGVVQCVGAVPQIISTQAVSYALQAIAEEEVWVDGLTGKARLAQAVAESYEYRGHVFYVLRVPGAETSWVYDLTTRRWHERGTWYTGDSTYEAWRPLYHTYAFGRHLMGDRQSGIIYEMSGDHLLDVGEAVIRRVRRAPVLSRENRRLRYDRFELDLEVGLGTVSGQGANPTVTLNFSNDAGKTWAAAGARTAGSGALGEYTKRVFWTRLGSARNRVFEVVVSDPIPWRLTQAYLEMTER